MQHDRAELRQSKGSLADSNGSFDSLGQPQQSKNEPSKRMSLTSLRQKAIQQLEIAQLKNSSAGYRAPSPSDSVSPSPILSKMPINDEPTSPSGLSHLTSARPSKPKARQVTRPTPAAEVAQVQESKVAVVEMANAQQEVKISNVNQVVEHQAEVVNEVPEKKRVVGYALPGLASANSSTLKKNAFIQQDKKVDEPEFMKFRRGLKSVSSSAPTSAVVPKSTFAEVPASDPVRSSDSQASLVKKGLAGSRTSLYQAPAIANGSVHDLTQQISKLKNVQSTSKTSLEGKEASELVQLRSQLKPAVDLQSNTIRTAEPKVPEFLAMRNKIKEASSQSSQSDISTPKSGAGNYSKFATAQKVPVKQFNTYVAPKVDSKAQTVNLKGVKGDSFLSVTGGSTRPTEPLLLLVKGKKKISASRVQTSLQVLNQTDAFILDVAVAGSSGKDDPEKPAMRNLFVCSGEKTSKVRRTKAIEMANLIKDSDYSGKADIVLVELGNIKERAINDKEMQFWQVVSGNSSITRQAVQIAVVAAPVESTDDAEYEKKVDEGVVAYNFSNGQATQVINNGKMLKHALLQTDQVLIVDCKTEIYVWAGKAAREESKLAAWHFAEKKAKDNKLPMSSVFKEGERFERVMFKSKFEDWPVGDNLRVHNVLEVKQVGNIQAKDKAWRVYDRGSDTRKVDKVDIVRMYDKNSAPELSVAKNSEAMDIDPAEIIKKDWGFGRMRIWALANGGNSDSTKTVQTVFDEAMLKKMERKFDSNNPFLHKSNECYAFLYEYKERPAKMTDQVLVERTKLVKEELIASMKENAVLYVWSGDSSSVSDQAIMAHFVVELEKMTRDGRLQVSAKAKHVRISEGKEPVHFLNAIRGGNIPRDQPSKILEMLPKADVPPSPVVAVVNDSTKGLFHAFGTYVDTTRVAQLESISASSLSSSASYVVKKDDIAYVWNGIGSFQWEQQAADKFAKIISKNVVSVQEGSEPDSFWKMFKNGKEAYDQKEIYKSRPSLQIQSGFVPVDSISLVSTQKVGAPLPYDVRLWKINFFINGNPTAQEICPFNSHDLTEDCVFILDSYFSLFVWIGGDVGRSKQVQRTVDALKNVPAEQLAGKSASSGFRDMRLAIETAINYADFVGEREQDRLSRSKAFVVQSGAEPLDFTSQFMSWDKRQKVDQWPSNINILQAYDAMFNQKYSLKELRKFAVDREKLPFGVDLERLETYLSDSDFESTFQMARDKFTSQPQWKQTDMKKKLQLF